MCVEQQDGSLTVFAINRIEQLVHMPFGSISAASCLMRYAVWYKKADFTKSVV